MAEYKRYQPKGSMCMACKFARENCSKLPFEHMQLMYSIGPIAIVRCDSFVADNRKPTP